MLEIGIFAEGRTDQVVIREIIRGVFAGGEEPEIKFLFPQDAPPDEHGAFPPGSWTVLFRHLADGHHRLALQTNDYIVIHVDTDVSDHVGFDVPHQEDVGAMISAVHARLIEIMGGQELFSRVEDRVIFAIAVDEVECWLLPLLFPSSKATRSKTTGCFEAADRALRTKGEPRLKKGDGKDLRGYERLAKAYRKQKTLMRLRGHNPSLEVFISLLEGKRAAEP
ncbi:MAG: hypothetical protein H6740_16975 [Alphaproteobacteria bacterium]|nr:hypothetical protein [Alphaproteobacteria bacterium]